MSLPLAAAVFILRTGIFAEGRFLGRMLDLWAADGEEFVHTKLPHLLMVALIAFILNRILHLITARMIALAEEHATEHSRVAQVKTLSGVVRATGITIISAIAGLQILDAVGVNLAPLLTSAGIAGVAIGLAAQNIVRDMFNGVLILLEDQFNVGDTVRIAGVAGTIESITLRKTTVRDVEGTLYIIPNSQIATVANLSARPSVATVLVSVDFSANPDEVCKLLTTIALEIRHEERFAALFTDDPQTPGLDQIKGSEMLFPVIFKTHPGKQYEPVREFKRRVRLALEERKMLPGDSMRVFSGFDEAGAETGRRGRLTEAEVHDPTAQKPPAGSLFGGE